MEKEITVVNFEDLDFNAQERLIKQALAENVLYNAYAETDYQCLKESLETAMEEDGFFEFHDLEWRNVYGYGVTGKFDFTKAKDFLEENDFTPKEIDFIMNDIVEAKAVHGVGYGATIEYYADDEMSPKLEEKLERVCEEWLNYHIGQYEASCECLEESYSDETAIFDYLAEQSREEGIMYTLSGICVGVVA